LRATNVGTDAMAAAVATRLSNVQAVLWDVDGTLADSTALGFTSTNAVLIESGLPTIDLAEYKFGTRYPTPERMAYHAAGTIDDVVLGKKLGDAFDEHYIKLVSTETAGFYPGMIELLAALNSGERRNEMKTPQAVLSNACGRYARRVVEVNQSETFFTHVFGADDAPAPKPSPLGLLALMRINRWDPHRCAYVGDSPSDGAAARAAGSVAVGCAWGAHTRASLEESKAFDVVVDDVVHLSLVLLG
jgi:phosphoglycolate phosphatase-like HAD superfamily hydrolase